MIEQVLYRRAEQGYKEYRSHGLSKEEAHHVNVVMDAATTYIGDLGSGTDSPFLLCPFEAMQKFCIAVFQREFSKGRSNSVNHALLIDNAEYKELVKNPDLIWGFTNKNFLSRKTNYQDELSTLKNLQVSENPELSKDYIFPKYDLDNSGFEKLLNAIYTSLSKDLKYSFGLRIDSSKDANKVMRHMGYLIMSMLPYDLRDKLSFCSRSLPESSGVAVQILKNNDIERTDITYDMDTRECHVNNPAVKIIDFYLKDLLSMSDVGLRDYFGILVEFKDNLELSENSEAEYVVSKLLKLSQNPSLFTTETADSQFKFINDALSLPTSNKDMINSIVVRLLPFVDSSRYMDAFNINFGLYNKLNPEKESDRRIMNQIQENLIQNYTTATNNEKKELFKLVFDCEERARTKVLLEKFVEINDIDEDVLLIDEYIKLYEEFFETNWMDALYLKIAGVFKQSDIAGKQNIWNYMYNCYNLKARNVFINNILGDEDEQFNKVIFNTLVELFITSKNQEIRDICYTSVLNVIHKENDDYRLNVLQEYNDVDEVEDSLWLETYNAIDDYQKATENIEFLRCLKDKYYKSSNPDISNLYLNYIDTIQTSEMEDIIRKYSTQTSLNNREQLLLDRIISILIDDKRKVSISVLKNLATIVNGDYVDALASYISDLYLMSSSDRSNEVYDFLQSEQPRLFDNPNLNKYSLRSYDHYLASDIDIRYVKGENTLLNFVCDLEKLQYRDESYNKIKLVYGNWIDQEIASVNNDYDRYLKCKAINTKIYKLLPTDFVKQYCDELYDRVADGFWNSSSIATFDYDHFEIYKSDSEIYDQKFENHKNHELAEKMSGMIEYSYVDWDKVYEIFLSKKYISQEAVRNKILEEFNKAYNMYGLSKSDQNYIAYSCVNLSNFKMDYSKLFDELQKYNYQVEYSFISQLKIFEYIDVSKDLKDKISQYKNYQSDNPTYTKETTTLLVEQIVLLVLLIANNGLRFYATNMVDNFKTKDLLLLGNCIGYIMLIVLVGITNIELMKRANKRRSNKYDKKVFGLLIATMLLSAAAILLSVVLTNIFICMPIAIVFIASAIYLILTLGKQLKKPKLDNKTRGLYL